MSIVRTRQHCINIFRAAVVMVLAGCTTSAELVDLPDSFSSFRRAHLIASDFESLKAGQQAIRLGGNAADATIAMSLTALVTLPGRTGIRAPGQCLTYQPETRQAQVIAFDGKNQTLIQSMLALHALHGDVPLGGLVAPALQRSRFGGGTLSAELNGGLPNGRDFSAPRPALAAALEALVAPGLDYSNRPPFSDIPGWSVKATLQRPVRIDLAPYTLLVPPRTAGAHQGQSIPTAFGAMDANGLATICSTSLSQPYGTSWDDVLDSAVSEPTAPARLYIGYSPANDRTRWLAAFAPGSVSSQSIFENWQKLLEDNNINTLPGNVGYAQGYCPIGLPAPEGGDASVCGARHGALVKLGGIFRQ